LSGGAGSDLLDGGAGKDIMSGGDGADTFVISVPSVTIGNFSIGFDASRASDTASGFFIEDTVGGLGILFDVSVPGELSITDSELTLADADLLLSSEFAGILGISDLTGADVGDARTDADVSPVDSAVQVESGVTSVFLDLPLLEEVAGLGLASVDTDAEPFSDDFQVGFDITGETDLTLNADLSLIEGSIEHSGTLTLLTLGTGGGADVIRDFELGDDLISLGSGLMFDQLSLAQNRNDTLISIGDEAIARVVGVTPNELSEANFVAA
ncbi:MAG TPA: hypothetical protein ACFE0H_13695, partial [Elainellaceae cyanobacterium]